MAHTASEYNLLSGTGVKALSRGSDYREWRLAVTDILSEKGYWTLVSPTGEQSDTSDKTTEEKIIKARGLLGRLLDSNHRELYATERDPKKLWAKLERRYAGKDQARIWYLRSELSNIQYEGEPIIDYTAKLEKLFNLLAGAGEQQSEKDKIYVLLSNLPSEYHPFRTSISNDPNFKDILYDNVCDRLNLEYQQLNGGQTHESSTGSASTNAFFANRSRGRLGRGRGGRGRGYSGRFFSPSQSSMAGRFGTRGTANEGAKQVLPATVDKDSCLYCKEKGHWIRNCPKKNRGNNSRYLHSANAANTPKPNTVAWMAHTTTIESTNDWILDSGASHHMSSHREHFRNFKECSTYVHIANGAKLTAQGVGDIWLRGELGDGATNEIQLRNVLYVPELGPQNLVSVRCIQQAGASIVFSESDGGTVTISRQNEIVAIGELQGNSYILLANSALVTSDPIGYRATTTSEPGTLLEWHQLLGHLGFDDVKVLAKHNSSMTITGSLTNPTCEHCIISKQTRKPNSAPATHRATELLELVHSDLAGPMSTRSLGGSKYFLLLIDDFSRYTKVYALKSKAETISKFREYKALVENNLGKKIKRFRSDGGGEYTSYEFDQLLRDSGIIREKTAPYSPEQNGVSERANRTIIGRAKAMLHQSGLGMEMWAEAVHMAVYLKNRSPTSALAEGLTPIEAWTGEALQLRKLINFGTVGYKHIPKQLRTKWEPNSQKGIFVGYEGTNQYRVLINKKIHITRDLTLVKQPPLETCPFSNTTRELVQIPDESDDDMSDHQPAPALPIKVSTEPSSSTERVPPLPTPLKVNTPGDFPLDAVEDMIHLQPESPHNQLPPSEPAVSQRSRRTNAGKFTSARFRDQQFSRLAVDSGPDALPACHAYRTMRTYDTEPNSYGEAVTGPNAKEWKLAIAEELASLAENESWLLTELPEGRSTVKCRWVFREKRGAEGEVIRYKARLVAKGFTQQYGIDYLKTYAPVVKLTSLRIILVLAAFYNFEIHQGDIKSAYLLGKLDEEIYMEVPEGIEIQETGKRRMVCRLLRGLYGLKQSGRIWNKAWDSFLVEKCGFTRSVEDYAVYYRRGLLGKPLWILIWVDDVLWIGEPADIRQAKKELGNQFPLKDLGPAHFFLGMKIIRQPEQHKITLMQDQYIDTVMKRFNFEDAYPVSTPMEPGSRLTNNSETPDSTQADEILYRSILGSMMYLMLCTRPDLAFAIGKLSKYSANPTTEHLKAAKRLLRYTSKTRNVGLHFGPFSPAGLPTAYVFSDADWAGDIENRRSTGAYICTISDGTSNSPHTAISWSSKQQPTIALSSTEAEYMAMTQACKEAIWVRRLLTELATEMTPYDTAAPITIFADNQGSMALAKNPEFHSRTKHIGIQHHFIREKVNTQEVTLEYLPTGDMLADLLTKALPREKVERFRKEMGIYEI